MPLVHFTVVRNGAAAYALGVGVENVRLSGGKGSIALAGNTEHIVVWRMRGDPGTGVSISYRVSSGPEAVLVKESKIQKGRIDGAGFAPIQL